MDNFNNSLNTSVTVVDKCLIVTLPNDITDDDIKISSSSILARASRSYIKGTILDFSMVYVLDSYSFKALQKVSRAILLMGVMVVWIGLGPGVVSSLMDLNVDVSHIKTAVDLEQGLKMILNSGNSRGKG
jgi:anti-anti-sigma regulatory factor